MGIVERFHEHQRRHEPGMVLSLALAEPGRRSRWRPMGSHLASSSPELLMTLAEVYGARMLNNSCSGSLTGRACEYLQRRPPPWLGS